MESEMKLTGIQKGKWFAVGVATLVFVVEIVIYEIVR